MAAATGHVRTAPPLVPDGATGPAGAARPDPAEQLTRFQSKAAGRFTVAVGGTLPVVGETWQIVQHYRWPGWALWLLVVAMLTAAVLNTAVLKTRDAHWRQPGGTEPPAASEQT